ncbi:autotransporter outer membrane beta-barrel domain-containing protein, partial [Salmonella enterica]|nr:autotransporter outer membrane beta-barrel domain-containing protein [Salmonella enterica]EIG9537502.1 autotransporter outer membrane beta-barrel domain-containing protein [Salmonella enterica]EIH0810186.1 autotransporter outer membrane beta-barrel domain-containing protein [Salmonella enterica]EIH2228903.1 autotransporter outer membrane beta-barrel domain-containing protein [Salmonella enterica]EIH3860999.1 autotransporter outer membrane beta-barrel domain-containing protein [Salmonella ent
MMAALTAGYVPYSDATAEITEGREYWGKESNISIFRDDINDAGKETRIVAHDIEDKMKIDIIPNKEIEKKLDFNVTLEGMKGNDLTFGAYEEKYGSLNVLISKSQIDNINAENTNNITISSSAIVEKIQDNRQNKSGAIINYGTVRGIVVGRTIVNHGIMEYGTGVRIINEADGLIEMNNEELNSDHLINRGRIHTNLDQILLLDDQEITNEGEITTKGDTAIYILVEEDGKTAKLTNTGTIEQTNNVSIRTFRSTITNGSSEPSVKTEITNTGRISSNDTAILLDNRGKDTGSSMTIRNNGEISGDILNFRDFNDSNKIDITNGETGRWSASFLPVTVGAFTAGPYYNILLNNGIISITNDDHGQTSEISAKTFTNKGTIDIRRGALEVHGDYISGAGAKLITQGELGGDETQLPTLTIHGTVSGETTHVLVDNIGGTGAATTDGILVVRADTVDGEGFTKEGRIVAGAYDYDLVRVESGDHTEWRLTSALTPVPPGPEPGPEPVPPAPVQVVRPEAVTYAENLRQANTLFMTDSEQRRAVGEYTDPVTGRTET